MIFKETELKGAFVIDLEKHEDERGFFARAWCKKEFESRGLTSSIVQSNLSYNRRKGTLRGMHYQSTPFAEAKLVRCVRGGIFDVIIDLREGSATFGQWIAAELTEDNQSMLYVPEGFAHGFQTIEDDTIVFYHVSQFYASGYEKGIRWDDPAFAIKWPDVGGRIISEKDRRWPDYDRIAMRSK